MGFLKNFNKSILIYQILKTICQMNGLICEICGGIY